MDVAGMLSTVVIILLVILFFIDTIAESSLRIAGAIIAGLTMTWIMKFYGLLSFFKIFAF
jgi:hypothetical protein